MRRGECSCKRFKKTLPILVLTFIGYGRLNQIILRQRFCLSFAWVLDGVSGIKTGFSENLHIFRVSLYVPMLLLKISLFDDNLEILLLMFFVICFLILGWLNFISMLYIGLSLGFLYGRYVLFVRPSFISKKLTTFKLALVVTDNTHFLNTRTTAFIFLTNSSPERFLNILSWSSL